MMLWSSGREERNRREMMKGICVEHFDRLCFNKTHNRNGHETFGSSFGGNRLLRLQNSSGWPPAGQHKSALPCCLNDTCIHRKEWYRKTMEREKKEKETDGRVFFSSSKGSELNFLDVWPKSRDPWRPVTVPTCSVHLNLNRKTRRYLQTIYMCGRLLSVSSSTNERTKRMFLWF